MNGSGFGEQDTYQYGTTNPSGSHNFEFRDDGPGLWNFYVDGVNACATSGIFNYSSFLGAQAGIEAGDTRDQFANGSSESGLQIRDVNGVYFPVPAGTNNSTPSVFPPGWGVTQTGSALVFSYAPPAAATRIQRARIAQPRVTQARYSRPLIYCPCTTKSPTNYACRRQTPEEIAAIQQTTLPPGASIGPMAFTSYGVLRQGGLGGFFAKTRRTDMPDGEGVYLVQINAPKGIHGHNICFDNATAYRIVDCCALTDSYIGGSVRGHIAQREFPPFRSSP